MTNDESDKIDYILKQVRLMGNNTVTKSDIFSFISECLVNIVTSEGEESSTGERTGPK